MKLLLKCVSFELNRLPTKHKPCCVCAVYIRSKNTRGKAHRALTRFDSIFPRLPCETTKPIPTPPRPRVRAPVPTKPTNVARDLVTSFPGTNFNGRVGVIAPYRNQIQALQRGMWSTGLRQDGVEVSTVDGFQGR